MRARQREAGGGDSHHRSHRDRSREGHSSRREKDAVPPVPAAPLRSNSSPAPDVESQHGDSPMASQADITSGAKRLSLIQSTATGVPPPPLSPHKGANGSSNRGLQPQIPGTFASEAYSKNTLPLSTSPRNSAFPPNSQTQRQDGLSPSWQQGQQQRDRSSTGSAPPRSPTSVHQNIKNNFPQTPQRKETRRSFNPLDAIIDGMERPYTPRTKNVTSNGASFKTQEGTYDDTSGDGIPDALKEYFQEVVEIEPAPPRDRDRRSYPENTTPLRTGSAIPNGHLQQPRSFFDTPSPSHAATSTNPTAHPTPESGIQIYPSASRSNTGTSEVEVHVKGASISSSRRQFEAYDGLEEQPPVPPLHDHQHQQQPASNNTLISPHAWMGSPSLSRPNTANRDPGSSNNRAPLTTSLNTSSSQPPRSPHTPRSAENGYFQHQQLKTPTDPYAHKPTTPTTPLTADGVIRPPPASIPRGVTREFEEGETESDSDFQSPMMKGVDAPTNGNSLVLSPTQLPIQELLVEEPESMPAPAVAAAAAASESVQTRSQSHPQGSNSTTTLNQSKSPSPSRPDTSASSAHSEGSQNQEGESSSSSSQKGLRKKRKHDDRAPALPPIRISQFYVDNPTKGGGIEVTQGPDDSISSSEGQAKREAGMESVTEDSEESYIMVQPQSDKVKSPEKEGNSPGKSSSLSLSGTTPTAPNPEDGRLSEDTPTTSEQSHDTTGTSTSQTSLSSAGISGSKTDLSRSHSSSNGSIDTMTTQTIVDHNLGGSIQRTGSKDSQTPGHAPTSSAGSSHSDEVYQVVLKSLNDLIENASKHDKSVVKLDLKFVEVIRKCLQNERAKHEELKGNMDSMKVRYLFVLSTSQATNLPSFCVT